MSTSHSFLGIPKSPKTIPRKQPIPSFIIVIRRYTLKLILRKQTMPPWYHLWRAYRHKQYLRSIIYRGVSPYAPTKCNCFNLP
ncbi:MAG TPA: hypothetical protein PLX23_04705, partial [Candidatus Hydrogenedens sp.]|nr:hypothetical protein [Candidatus Hydrogenedens sp.]